MAKKKSSVTKEEALALPGETSGEAAPATEKKVRKAPQPRELPDQTLYLTEKFSESGTVFGSIREFVAENGGSALRSAIVAHMVQNFKPKKSTMAIEPFVNSYMRDVVKLGHLSDTDLGIKVLPVKPEKPKKESTKDANGLSELGKKLLKTLAGELSEGEVANGTSSVTIDALATLVDKNAQNLRMSLKSLISKKLAEYSTVDEKEVVLLTQAGWDLANAPEAAPAEAA